MSQLFPPDIHRWHANFYFGRKQIAPNLAFQAATAGSHGTRAAAPRRSLKFGGANIEYREYMGVYYGSSDIWYINRELYY